MNIFLCGFMGCGKSTVGKILAEKSGRAFTDMDSFIEEREGMAIPEIFAARGEKGFREAEAKASEALGNADNAVIACGGGAALFERNIDFMKKNGVLVLLDVPWESLIKRLRADSTPRPIITDKTDDEIFEIYSSRMPIYRKNCTFSVPCGDAPAENAENILNFLKKSVDI